MHLAAQAGQRSLAQAGRVAQATLPLLGQVLPVPLLVLEEEDRLKVLRAVSQEAVEVRELIANLGLHPHPQLTATLYLLAGQEVQQDRAVMLEALARRASSSWNRISRPARRVY